MKTFSTGHAMLHARYEFLSGGDVFQRPAGFRLQVVHLKMSERLHKCHCGQQGFPWHDRHRQVKQLIAASLLVRQRVRPLDRLSVLLDAASGLSHMHNATPKATHPVPDMKPKGMKQAECNSAEGV